MIPHHIKCYRCNTPCFRTEPAARLFDFRQVVGQYVDTTVHMDAGNYLRRIVFIRIAANKIGQQITGKRTVGEVCEVQVREKIHLSTLSFTLLLCWLRVLTPVTTFSLLVGIFSLAAAMHLE